MYQLILVIHVLVAAFIVLLVLIQQGKGATMGAAFGSGASQTVFGARGSGSFLFRVTMGCVALFFATSLGLNYLAARAYKQEKVITLPAAPVKNETAPAVPDVTTPVENQSAPAPAPAPTTDQIPVKE